MENKIEMLKQVSDLINTLTFVQSSLLEDDNLRTEVFIDHACRELSYIKYDYKKNTAEREQLESK